MRYPLDHALTIAGEIPGQTWPSELRWLYQSLISSRRHLEVGVYAGRSLFMASHGMLTGEIIGVDARVEDSRGIPPRFLKEVTNVVLGHCNPAVKVQILECTSSEAAKKVLSTFDSVFIDAGHEHEAVLTDISLWAPRVKSGGFICGHDYWPNHWGVMEAVQQYFRGSHEVVSDTRIWFRRL